MNAVKLMTNIKPDYYAFIEKEAKSQKKTKRAILEEAIRIYMREKKRQAIIDAYEGIENDKEYLEESLRMAEEGMQYYLTDMENAYKEV